MIESHWRRRGDLEGAAWWIAKAGALLLLAAALALAPFRWTVLLMAAAAGGLAILVHPWLVLLVIAWAAPFGPLVPLPIAGAAADVNELLMAALAGAWVAQGAVRRQIVIPRAPLQTPILLLLGAYGFSLLGAWSLRDGLVESVKWVEGALLYLATIALLPRRRAPWLIGAILAAGAAQETHPAPQNHPAHLTTGGRAMGRDDADALVIEKALRDLPATTRRAFLRQAALLGTATAVPVLIRRPVLVTAAPGPRRGGTVRVTGHHEIST